ncbi:hypothetical protein D3C76_881780 [compost metagenome]
MQGFVLGADGVTLELVRREEVLFVVQRQRPEPPDWRQLAFGERDAVAVPAVEAQAVLIQVLVEVFGLFLLVHEDVRTRDGGTGEIVGAERCTVAHGAPVIGQLQTVVAELQQRVDHFAVGLFRLVDHRSAKLRVGLGDGREGGHLRVAGFFPRQWLGVLEQGRQLIEELLRHHPPGFGIAFRSLGREFRQPGPVALLHLAVVLRQRVHVDARQSRLHGLAVGGGVVLEYPRDHEPGVRTRPVHPLDAGRHLAVPVRADQQVETRLGVIHFAHLDEAVRTQVHHLIHPESAVEVRHLQHHRLNVQGDAAGAVHHVLVRTGHQPLGRVDVVAEHRQPIDRGHGYDAAHQAGFRQVLEGLATIEDVGHRPGPEIRLARHHAHIRFGYFGAGDRA